jgi:hypothetical protein
MPEPTAFKTGKDQGRRDAHELRYGRNASGGGFARSSCGFRGTRSGSPAIAEAKPNPSRPTSCLKTCLSCLTALAH